MSFVQAGSTRLAWQQLGEGPDIVLVHGLATNRAFWYASLAQQLRTHYRVTLFDLRGHGYSDMPPSGYAARDMGQDLAAVIDNLDLDPLAVIAHSYGGSVALEYAVSPRARLRALVLMDARINSLQPEQWLADAPHLTAFEQEVARADGRDWYQEPQIGFAFLEAMARLRTAGFTPSQRDPFTPFADGKGGKRGAMAFCRLLDRTTARDDFLQRGAEREQLQSLDIPVQLLYGAHSRNLPSGEALAACLPDATLQRIAEAGHFFPLSHASEVARLVAEFLDAQRKETTV
ncbi:alpha/beta hydrolase [Algiphilus sp. NNCM1]|uniref:alpha/beta fold hydrolase n=1 Tax=Algiphilus sp. TaxID=1872431 RepID=UPI001CA6DCFB|nr:alpha/beta hydrolase [Algiphilus sp.]MBY8966093.1 alpha/beta hydrolase [Algiphilus acroporae]MCI5062822.1 alpha/beta hydrolase [Algiphilus sp.]MCI5104890.1 alpha/beta hydrolase [Algiphilus sp.]